MAKRKRSGRKTYNIPLAAIGAGFASAQVLGIPQAAQEAMRGDFRAAQATLAKGGTLDNVIVAAVPPLVVGILGKVVGPVQVFRFGKYRITMFPGGR